MNAQAESYTRLQGKWLNIARLAWIATFIALAFMYVFGFFAVHDALSRVCEEEPCTLYHPIRHTQAGEQVMDWGGPPIGFANPLRPDQVKALAKLGLTLHQYGWLGALQMGIPALLYLLIAAGLFWRKSDDWMVLFISTVVMTSALVDMPLPYTLVVRQPLWQWVHTPAYVVAVSSWFFWPLVFPNGRFIPRWTRWKILFDIALAIHGVLSQNSILPSSGDLGYIYVVLSICTNVYALSYRYFRVANPVERQQIKWVFVGLIGFITIAFAALQLHFQLNSQAESMDLSRALILSVIPNTLYRAVTLFIPVSIAISVLRYRLWDIDVIINRTLVYGALTTGVISLYVLIVGWSSIGLQTQNSMAGKVLAILVIAFLFRPLRQQLQHIADRYVPVPKVESRESSSPPTSQTQKGQEVAVTDGSPNTTLRGRWLLSARLAWVIGFITLTALYAFGFLAVHDTLSTVCEEEQCTLKQQTRHTAEGDKVISWKGTNTGYADRLHPDQVGALETLGLTLNQYGLLATLQMGIPVLMYLLTAAVLFSRKSNDWMALFVSTMVMMFPLVVMPLYVPLVVRQPIWQWISKPADLVSFWFFLIFPLVFPNGQFVPRWTRWKVLFDFAYLIVSNFILPEPPAAEHFRFAYSLISFCVSAYALAYRYFRVASPLERQQIKWVVAGLVGFIIIGVPLDALATSQVANADLARGLVLSAILDTLFQAISLFIPMSIVISVLRYRLWDIDIIISRTLVYGILSAGIVVTYILLVGLLGTLFNTNVSLAATLVTAALTISFFQPFRARIQSVVNHITFGGQNMTAVKQEIEETPTESGMSLSPRWLQVMHSAWFICALLTVIILIGTVPVYYGRYLHPSLSDPYSLGQFNVPFQALIGLGAFAESFISFGLAILLFWHKPNDRMALFLSFFFLITTVSSTYDYFLNPYVGSQTAPPNFISSITFPLWILLFCIFPDGRFVPRWTRWLFLVSILASFSYIVFPDWFFILQFTAGPQFFLATYAQVYRYRRISNDEERKQTKWAVFGWLVVMVLSLIASFIYKKPSGPLINVFPLFVAIAILHSRLWNIDLILNRALVYGALTAGIVALYILLVGTLSLLSQTTGNLLISLLATGLIAFLFQPLRERLQGSVNRLLYGDRDDPYVMLARLGRRLESTLAPEAVLPMIVTTVRECLKLPYTAIYLKQDDNDHKIVAESAAPTLRVENGMIKVPGIEREGQCIPLIHQGETLGYLVLGPRTPNEAFTSSDLRLVDDLAPQLGVAVHAMRLTADLQRSREQLVLTREEERRRLRRDLHDGLGPNLASQGLKLAAVQQLLESNPSAAKSLLEQVMEQNNSTVADVRRLVYGLRPPALDELGLVAAIRDHVAGMDRKSTLQVDITEPAEGLPPLSAAVEVAAYRITLEALTNVIRHAQAENCTIQFSVCPNGTNDELQIEIQDDGKGMSEIHRAGVGLRSMRERAEELGGSCSTENGAIHGMRVLVRLPIGKSKENMTGPDR